MPKSIRCLLYGNVVISRIAMCLIVMKYNWFELARTTLIFNHINIKSNCGFPYFHVDVYPLIFDFL